MSVKQVNFQKTLKVVPEVVAIAERTLERAKAGEISDLVVITNGAKETDFSFHTESESGADAVLGFFERVGKPTMAETYTFDAA